jgi:cobalamin biosynthesis protein CobT
VTVSVWGHTGNCSRAEDGALIFRYIEAGIGHVDSLGSIKYRHNNFDSWAASWCAKRLLSLSKGEHRVLFVLSDGKPAGNSGRSFGDGGKYYGGSPAMEHMRKIVEHGRRQGVTIFGLGIGGGLTPADLEAMYGKGNWLLVEQEKDMPGVLAKLTRKIARTGAAA